MANFNNGVNGAPQNRTFRHEKMSKERKSKVLKRLVGYLFRYKSRFFLAFAVMVSANLLKLVGPKLSGNAIDAIATGSGGVNFELVIHYCLLLFMFYTCASILDYILQRTMIKLSQGIVYSIRKEMFEKLTRLPVGYFDTHQTGDIISRFSYDVDNIQETLGQGFLEVCVSIISVAGSFLMMLTISAKLIFVFFISIPISLGVAMVMSKKVRPLFRKRSAKLGELNGYIEEIVSGQKTIKAYNREEIMIGRFDEKNKEAAETQNRADAMGGTIGPCVGFVNNLSMALISVLGSILYIFGFISIGNVSSFVLYSRKFAGPINELSGLLSEFQSSLSAAERIFRLMDELPEPEDIENAKVLDHVKGDVEFDHVKFGYTPEKEIIHDLSVKADAGNLIAIVGHTGAGKTTLINLLMRFYDVNSGKINVDNKEIRDLTRDSLRISYAMVLQDTWLFNGSIYDNIAYGNENATMEQVQEAAKAAHIHNYIMSLPEGYNTIIDDDGVNISKGQKQLITIARAMLLDAKMLILDEATSNVDTITEMKIQNAMRKLMVGKTCFVIAHRLSTIKNADNILVVDKGDIVEQGTHEQLLAMNGAYASLYNSQF